MLKKEVSGSEKDHIESGSDGPKMLRILRTRTTAGNWIIFRHLKTIVVQENIRPRERGEGEPAEKNSSSSTGRSNQRQAAGLTERLDNLPRPRSEGDEKLVGESSVIDIVRQLSEMCRKLDTLTQTVLFMEKRLCLLEDQVKILSSTPRN